MSYYTIFGPLRESHYSILSQMIQRVETYWQKKKMKNGMVRIGEQGTSYPPQMVNQTQLITSMLEVCWVVYWLIATLLVMTLQTAAQVHFICKNSGFSTPPRTSRDSFNKPKQRIKKWTATHSTLLRWQALKEQENHCEMWSRVSTERCSRKQLHRRWDVWLRRVVQRGSLQRCKLVLSLWITVIKKWGSCAQRFCFTKYSSLKT